MSKKGEMSKADWKAFGLNIVKFVAPTLALFFGLLAQDIPFQKAWPVAALAFYQAVSDYFNKLNSGK